MRGRHRMGPGDKSGTLAMGVSDILRSIALLSKTSILMSAILAVLANNFLENQRTRFVVEASQSSYGYEHNKYAPANYMAVKQDPRFARSLKELMCVRRGRVDEEGVTMLPGTWRDNAGQGGQGPRSDGGHTKEGTIGCCPNEPNGKPFGPGKACCWGRIYDDDGIKFCCDNLGVVMDNNEYNWKTCQNAGISYCEPVQVPSPMVYDCTDGFGQGSNCTFSCPSGLRIKEPDDPTFFCNGDGQWIGDQPECCLTDGCSKNLKVDFYFIIDSSSSIKKENFQYIREYIVQLVSSLPIGQDKVRVGLITYNSYVKEIFRFDQFQNQKELIEAVWQIPYSGRGTYTNKAIVWATEQGMIAEKGDRPNVPNFIVVLTDGKARDNVRIGAPGLQAKGAVVVIGVGKRINKRELVTIAGDESKVYLVSDFRSLGNTASLSQTNSAYTSEDSFANQTAPGRGRRPPRPNMAPHMRLSQNRLCPTRCAHGDFEEYEDY